VGLICLQLLAAFPTQAMAALASYSSKSYKELAA